MQQRRLRLGDIVDDYCPRERRITNHAIVAMIEDEVKQTRCTTCDADHEYKQARIPAQRRKKDASPALSRPAPENGGTADAPDQDVTSPQEMPRSEPEAAHADEPSMHATNQGEPIESLSEGDAPEPAAPIEDEGPVHRRLIRATLPRPEGQAPERKMPDFTMHQREANGNRAGRPHRRGPRHGQTRGPQGGGGNQPTRFGQRQGPRHGSGSPSGHGTGQGQPRRRKRRR